MERRQSVGRSWMVEMKNDEILKKNKGKWRGKNYR